MPLVSSCIRLCPLRKSLTPKPCPAGRCREDLPVACEVCGLPPRGRTSDLHAAGEASLQTSWPAPGGSSPPCKRCSISGRESRRTVLTPPHTHTPPPPAGLAPGSCPTSLSSALDGQPPLRKGKRERKTVAQAPVASPPSGDAESILTWIWEEALAAGSTWESTLLVSCCLGTHWTLNKD